MSKIKTPWDTIMSTCCGCGNCLEMRLLSDYGERLNFDLKIAEFFCFSGMMDYFDVPLAEGNRVRLVSSNRPSARAYPYMTYWDYDRDVPFIELIGSDGEHYDTEITSELEDVLPEEGYLSCEVEEV